MKYEVKVESSIPGIVNGPAILQRHLHSALFQAGSLAQFNILKRTPVDLGTARNSIQLRVFMDGDPRAVISSGLEYIESVEEGRKAGVPPPASALEGWVKRVINPDPKEVKGIAFTIARAIGQGSSRGTANKGVHMFKKGLQDSKGGIIKIFEIMESRIVTGMNQGGV